MASILVKTSGVKITKTSVYVPDPPVAPPQPTQSPASSGSGSGAGASSGSSGSQSGTTYGPDYYQNYASSLNNILNCPEGGNAGSTILGGGYNSNFLSNSTSTSSNYQNGGGGGSTSSSNASSSTSSSQQSSSNSSSSGSTGSSGSSGSSSSSGSPGSSGLYSPAASSPVYTVQETRPQLSEMMECIIGQIKAEGTFSTWELSYAASSLFYTAWILCTAMHGEPIVLWANVRSIDGSKKFCVGIVTPEFLIKKFSGIIIFALNPSLGRSRIEEICNDGWDTWLNWYAANKATIPSIDHLYNTTQIKLATRNGSVDELTMTFRDEASGMSFPARMIALSALKGSYTVIERSVLPASAQADANKFTVTL